MKINKKKTCILNNKTIHAYAITMQKKGGTFVLKVFDLFLKPSVQLLYLLSCCYEQVYIIKPYTSRTANSERYVICKGFKLEFLT